MKVSRQHINAPIANARRLLTTTALFLCASPATLLGDTIPYSHGDPTNLEQYQLELVNAARANPKAQATKLGIDLNKDLTPGRISEEAKQPLAFHPKLLQTARGHSDWMLEEDAFSHTGLNGSTLTERAASYGYDFSVAENIAYQSTSSTPNYNSLTVSTHENLFKSYTHRPNLMDPSFSVVGLGLREGKFREKTGEDLNALMVTQNFSRGWDSIESEPFFDSIESGPFLVGVVYKDLNGDGDYDPGEGIPDVRVEPDFGGYHAITSTSGGFAVPIPPPLETLSEDYRIPLAVNSNTWDAVRPYDLAFRKSKIDSALLVTIGISWSGGGLSQASQSFVTIHQPSRINYKLIGTDNYRYQKTMVSSLNVKADFVVPLAPNIISQPSSQNVSLGAVATFSVSANGTSPSYQWHKNGTPISGATASSHTIPIAQASDAGNYTVTVFNTAGSVTSNAATLTVGPTITSDLSTVSIPKGKLIPRFTITTNFGAKSFTAKGLPKGLKLNTTNGVITGKPTKPGTYTVGLTAKKMKGKKVEQQATATKVFVVY
jgi:uncharacterized protein YkwD